VPKPNDLGSVHLWDRAPDWASSPGSAANFIELAPRPRLVLHCWRKTWRPGARPFVVKLPPLLTKALRASLHLFPRDRLFLDSRGQPFAQPNSLAMWFQPQSAAMFVGRRFSTTLLRHSFCNQLDMRMSKAARAQVARLLLHDAKQTSQYKLNVRCTRAALQGCAAAVRGCHATAGGWRTSHASYAAIESLCEAVRPQETTGDRPLPVDFPGWAPRGIGRIIVRNTSSFASLSDRALSLGLSPAKDSHHAPRAVAHRADAVHGGVDASTVVSMERAIQLWWRQQQRHGGCAGGGFRRRRHARRRSGL
jgi:hypothetical protein